jgi:hypothetical protein
MKQYLVIANESYAGPLSRDQLFWFDDEAEMLTWIEEMSPWFCVIKKYEVKQL